MKDPLVSIIIPVYNGSNYMKEAIDSALNQTYQNIEVIVVNDGSTDGGKTDKIARSYGDKIRYFKKENGGVSSAINYGLSKMQGEFFSWLSHDDMYYQNKVAAEIEYLKTHHLLNQKVILYSNYTLVDKFGHKISDLIINHDLVEKKPIYALMRSLLNGNSILIPKSAWDKYGPLDTKLYCTQDYAKWFEMNQTYRFVHVPKTLIKSRYHSGQATNTDSRVRTEGNKFWIKMIKTLNEKDQIKLNGSSYIYYHRLITFLANTPYDEALSYCQTQIKKYPKEPVPEEQYISYEGKTGLFSKNPLIKFFQLIKYEGYKNTVSRILKKLKLKK
jgi:glycosyltransferase involved in cell wall biosynthesis